MTRRQLTDYAGARGRLTYEQATDLTGRYWYQPKVDGAYCRISLDARGCIASLVSRAGKEFPRGDVGDLIGQQIGAPHSVYVGELEAHTEASVRERARRGYPLVHLFDAIYHGRQRITDQPYRYRYGALQAARAEVEIYGGVTEPWVDDEHERAHDATTGRYTRRVPRGWRRAPILPLWHPRELEARWGEYVERDGGEGIVAVAVDAPMGRRRAKIKIKATDTIDARIAEVDGKLALLVWAGGSFVLTRPKGAAVGDAIEIACDGFYEATSSPRFPRVVRVRSDLGM